MKKILVTGGCGFIGSNFIRHVLSRENVCVTNLDALTYAGNPDNLSGVASSPSYRFIHGNIGDYDLVLSLLREHKIDAVVNFAAESHVDRSIDDPDAFLETNVMETSRLLRASLQYYREQAKEISSSFRFLHVSTDEVYGSLAPEEPPFLESNPYHPNSPYSASKAASDHLVRAYHHTYGLPVITTNCSNNYGPYQFPEKLIPLMILNALEEKPLPIYGDGLNVRDWLYVEDHCSALCSVLEKGRVGETYNVGGLNEMTNLEIVDTICETLDEIRPRSRGDSYKDLKTFVADRPGHDRRYAINCQKIQQELGWSPQETFVTGFRKTIQWYLDNLAWCQKITDGTYQRERLGL